ncbi:unnamed protein product, partial [marine sediment metagenome]
TIKTQLEAGTYPDDTLSSDNIFDYAQYEGRRRYPSCEIETVQPESTNETKKSTETTVAFEIRYFVRNLGIRTDEIASQKLVEDVIMAQMESMTLQDHKVVFESKTWKREQVNKAPSHPAYTVSILRVTIRQVTTTTATADGTLKFILAGSTVDSAPAGDYTYTNVFNVDLKVGYRDIEEGHVGTNLIKHFAGHITGNFIASIMVKSGDLGTTGDKLNKMPKLTTLGEKPVYQFEYANLTSDSSTITNTFDCEVDSVQM